jgi:hypothetical protein
VLPNLSRLSAPFLAAIVAAACGAPAPQAMQPQTVAPSASAAAAAANHCQSLERRGITPCPPANLSLEPIAIRNGTHGAVDDATVRTAGEAYLRVHALYVWAVHQANGDAFLLSGAVVPPEVARSNIFRGEVKVFSDARAAGGTVRFEPLKTTAITLVPVPQDLRAGAVSLGLSPSPYAWVDNQSGPARVDVVGPGTSSHEVISVASGEPMPILVFGQVRNDVDLGTIWYSGGMYGCLTTPELRATCGY